MVGWRKMLWQFWKAFFYDCYFTLYKDGPLMSNCAIGSCISMRCGVRRALPSNLLRKSWLGRLLIGIESWHCSRWVMRKTKVTTNWDTIPGAKLGREKRMTKVVESLKLLVFGWWNWITLNINNFVLDGVREPDEVLGSNVFEFWNMPMAVNAEAEEDSTRFIVPVADLFVVTAHQTKAVAVL